MNCVPSDATRDGNYTRRVMLGPFIGELGWEIMAWQAWCRRLAEDRPGEYYAVGYPDRAALYQDFATFVPLRETVSPDSADSYMNRDVSPEQYGSLVMRCAHRVHRTFGPVDEIVPVPYLPLPVKRARQRDQLFVYLGNPRPRHADLVVVFPRQRQGREAFRNWQQPKWVELVKWLLSRRYRVVTCGRPDQACLVEYNAAGVINNIGGDLESVVGWLNRAKYAISPQSGTSTLTMLSGCPLMGFGLHDHKRRTELDENPLDTPAIHYHDGEKEIGDISVELMKSWVLEFEKRLDENAYPQYQWGRMNLSDRVGDGRGSKEVPDGS